MSSVNGVWVAAISRRYRAACSSHVLHRAIALLCGILDEVLKVGICKNVALKDARHFVPCTAYHALRALQCDQRLVGDELRQVMSSATVVPRSAVRAARGGKRR